MIIGIDGNEANIVNRVGIGEYAFELLFNFEKISSICKLNHRQVKFYIYLKDSPLSHMPKERNGWSYRVIGPKKLWTQIALPIDLYLHRLVDVFFTPTHYSPRFSPIPTAVSIMDISYIMYPNLFKKKDLYQLINWTKYSIKNAKKIFTISNASKNDIINHYKLIAEKVVVTYPGIKKFMINEKKSINEQKKDYILFVGTLQPRKNIARLIEAFSYVIEKNKNLNLVIVGKKGWQYEEILTSPIKWGIEDNVIFKDFVTDLELESLYSNATCMVLPSLYEGFGLPVLEAMKHNCPVIVSNVSSLPEVGGDAVLYINPEDPYDIAEKINKIISNGTLRNSLIAKGKKQFKKFSWEKAARETLNVLEEMNK